MSPKTMKLLAKPMLFAAALIWGTSFFIMKNALDVMPVFFLLAVRFTAGAVLLACSALGLPVSTTHAKVAAVCGAGRGASRAVMGQMAGAWILTFPACGGIAFLLARIMQG